MAALVISDLKNTISGETTNESVIPFTRRIFRECYFDSNGIRGRRFRAFIVQMEVERIEDHATARAQMPEANAQGVEYSRFSRIILANKHCRIVECQFDALDATKILDTDDRDSHINFRSESDQRLQRRSDGFSVN